MLFTQAFDESDTEQVRARPLRDATNQFAAPSNVARIEFEYRTCEANAGEPCVISDHWGHVMRTVVIIHAAASGRQSSPPEGHQALPDNEKTANRRGRGAIAPHTAGNAVKLSMMSPFRMAVLGASGLNASHEGSLEVGGGSSPAAG